MAKTRGNQKDSSIHLTAVNSWGTWILDHINFFQKCFFSFFFFWWYWGLNSGSLPPEPHL
jgi:hypothetical protein